MLDFTPKDKIIKEIVNLQSNLPFFSYLVMNLTLKEEKRILTCGVSEFGIFYWNSDFIESLSCKDLYFVLCHECLHVAKGDFYRVEDRDKQVWNIASDFVINYMLETCGITISNKFEYCFPDSKGNIVSGNSTLNIKNKTTEEVYDFLINNISSKNNQNIKKLIDEHIYGDGSSDLEDKESQDNRNRNAENWQRKAVEASIIHSRDRGDLPGILDQFVSQILNPQLNWKDILRKYIVNVIPTDYNTKRPSKLFYATRAWTPSLLRNNLDIICGIDVSGSVIECIEKFLTELYGIIKSYEQIRCRVIFWDTEVHEGNNFILNSSTSKERLKLLGLKDVGGGTNLTCFTNYCIEKKYNTNLYIILTDGHIEQSPKMTRGTKLFVLTKDGDDSIIKKYGKYCRLKD